MGAGTGMTCFGFPGGIGTASRVASATTTSGVLLLCNFGDREYLDLLGTGSTPFAARPAASRLLHRRLRDRRAAVGSSAAAAGAAPAAGARSRRLVRGGGLGRDRPRLRDLDRGRPAQRAARTPTSPPPTRRPTRPSTTAWWPPGRPSGSTAAGRTSFRSRRSAGCASPAGCSGSAGRSCPGRSGASAPCSRSYFAAP